MLVIEDWGGDLCGKQSSCHFIKMFSYFVGIDFKIKTVELGGKKIKLQIW